MEEVYPSNSKTKAGQMAAEAIAARIRSLGQSQSRRWNALGASLASPSSDTTATIVCLSTSTSARPAAATGPMVAPSATSPSVVAAASPSARGPPTPTSSAWPPHRNPPLSCPLRPAQGRTLRTSSRRLCLLVLRFKAAFPLPPLGHHRRPTRRRGCPLVGRRRFKTCKEGVQEGFLMAASVRTMATTMVVQPLDQAMGCGWRGQRCHLSFQFRCRSMAISWLVELEYVPQLLQYIKGPLARTEIPAWRARWGSNGNHRLALTIPSNKWRIHSIVKRCPAMRRWATANQQYDSGGDDNNGGSSRDCYWITNGGSIPWQSLLTSTSLM
uniref:Prolamin box-binding factor n=1 Tax=Triticum aestivum TaxID=4565 RepID=A0A2I1_WHEAT|nr:prolamin box-binding factor [Triticum aestivum]ABJ80650.1 prolamin box-binding factor [Triticum aestivum]